MHLRVAGIDLVSEQIRLAIGLGPIWSTALIPPRSLTFAYMTTNAISSGVIGEEMSFLDRYLTQPGVVCIRPRIGVGDYVVGPKDGQPSWLVEIWMVFENCSSEEAASRICVISDMIACDFESNYQ
jgi:hypothetical protein